MAHVTSWRSSPWARWLGWTVVFGLVVSASWAVGLVAAFLIGRRFRSWWWVAGPAVADMVLTVAVAPTTGGLAVALEDAQRSGVVSGGMSAFVFALFFALAPLVGGGLLYAIPSLLGVWWGKRQEAANVGSIRSSLDGAASP